MSYNECAKDNDTLSSSSWVILQLCQDLSQSYEYVIFTDNFFSNVKLFKALKSKEFDACDIAKSESEYSIQLLSFRFICTKVKNWDLKAHMNVDSEILCLVWQDNNVLQYMITSHTEDELEDLHFLHHRKRWEISSNFIVRVLTRHNNRIAQIYLSFIAAHSIFYNDWFEEEVLSISLIIKKYNDHMKDLNENDQQRFYYSLKRRNRKFSWSLFKFLLSVVVLNIFKLFTLRDTKRITHRNFVLQLAVALMQNSIGNERHRKHQISVNISNKADSSKHHYIKLVKRSYCKLCSKTKSKNFTRSKKRKPLGEIDTNRLAKRTRVRERGAETSWECAAPECKDKSCCRKSECWIAIHEDR